MSSAAQGSRVRRTLVRAALLLGLPALLTSHGGVAFAQAAGSGLAQLQARLRAEPGNTDLRLKVATQLFWRGQRAKAREFALAVIARAPRYWGAHLLLARLDGLDRRCDSADARVQRVLAQISDKTPVLELRADIAIWCGRSDVAQGLIEALLRHHESADLLSKLASIHVQRRHHLRSYLLGRRALAREPGHEQARRLTRAIRLAAFEATYELELFAPGFDPDDRRGHGAVVSATALPGSWLSVTVVNTFRHRFQRPNNRLQLRADWRFRRDWRLGLLAAFGQPAHVIPSGSAGADLTFPVVSWADCTSGYVYDHMPWDADLHRLRFGAGVNLPAGLRAEAAYSLGLLDWEADLEVIHAVDFRMLWEQGRWLTYLSYAFGRDLERVPAILEATGGLFVLEAHAIGAQARYEWARFWVRGGYTVHLRDNQTQAHILNLGFGVWI